LCLAQLGGDWGNLPGGWWGRWGGLVEKGGGKWGGRGEKRERRGEGERGKREGRGGDRPQVVGSMSTLTSLFRRSLWRQCSVYVWSLVCAVPIAENMGAVFLAEGIVLKHSLLQIQG